jgi:hypothetical protein
VRRLLEIDFQSQAMKMIRDKRRAGLVIAVAVILVAVGVSAQDQQPQKQTRAAEVSVNDLAEKPGEYLGPVQLVGVVALVSQGKGFVLVDKREYADCGLSCLAEPGTKRVPVRWSGDAPKPEQTVRVAGILSRTEKGLSFDGQEVESQ